LTLDNPLFEKIIIRTSEEYIYKERLRIVIEQILKIMVNKEEIIELLKDFTDNELIELQDSIQFIRFKRIRTYNNSKESLLKLLKSKGIESFEALIKKIKEAPFTRSEYGYIYCNQMKEWISINFELTEDQSQEIINLSYQMGLLAKSMGDNYK
jgi:hypothetical protein